MIRVIWLQKDTGLVPECNVCLGTLRYRVGNTLVCMTCEPPSPPPSDFTRAGGEVTCETCGEAYYDHPKETREPHLDWEGRPFLHQLCGGKLVKL